MNSILLTIVIPVYNVSQYVEKCIRSCYKQNVPISNFEVIIVNDGSTDDSLEICEKLKKEFTELKIISQKNKGLSGARNTGLKNANGKYIWFVDSDDWVEEDCFTVLFENLKQLEVDLFWIGHDVIYNGVSNRKYIPNKIDNPITGEKLFVKHLNNLFYIWKFIYKKEFLVNNSLEFYEGLIYEDLEFTPRALLKAKSCYTIHKSFYNYLIRNGSIASISNIKSKSINDRLYIIDKLNELIKIEGVSPNYAKKLKEIILDSFLTTIKMSSRGKLTLPPLAFALLKKIKAENYKIASKKLDYFVMKINLSMYHYIYKTAYILSSKIKTL